MKYLTTLFALSLCAITPAQTFTNYTTTDGLPSDNLRDVSIATNGDLWLATQQGVSMFDGTSFINHNTTSHPGLASNDVTCIAVISNGDVWAGTDVGVSVFDGMSYTTYTTADGLSDNQIQNIKQAPNGDVWLATINGATRIAAGVFTAFGSPNIPFGGVQHIAFGTNGDVWMSGGLGGAIIYDGSSFTYLTNADGLISNRVTSIAIDASQNKWIGTVEGISTFNAANTHTGDHTRPFTLPAPDTLNPITDVVISSAGNVWAGIYVDYLVTEGGVSAYDGTNWTQYETTDGLAGPNVRRLAIDANDDVWVTTSTGLTKISDLDIGITESSQIDRFSIYPNPASSTLNINIISNELVGEMIEVFDAQLRLLRKVQVQELQTNIDVTAFNTGTYFFRIGSGVQKFIVSK